MNYKLSLKALSYLLFILVLITYGTIAWDIRHGILPVWSDEFFYYINALNYFIHGSLEAAVTYTGKGAPVFGADCHGFMYSLFHGTIAQAVGFHYNLMPYTNLFLLGAAIAALFVFSSMELEYKCLLSAVLLGYITVTMYTFTFMQESIHFIFAVCCSLLLIKIYSSQKPRDIIVFILILLFASLFRNLWLFWTITLLPLSKSRKDFLIYLSIFITSAVIALLMTQLFWDFIPSTFGKAMSAVKSGQFGNALSLFSGNVTGNIKMFIFGEGYGFLYACGKFVHIPIFIYICVHYVKTKEPIFLAALLIYSISFLLLMVCFWAGSWGEMRTMAPLYYLFAILVFNFRKMLPVYALVAVTLATFPANYSDSQKYIQNRTNQKFVYTNETAMKTFFTEVGSVINLDRTSLVYLGYKPDDFTPDLLFLPLKSSKGQKIKYAVNYFNLDTRSIKYDYIVSMSPLFAENCTMVLTNGTLYLYKLT